MKIFHYPYPKYGIISGAGPEAGITLYQHIVSLLQKQGACADADFPYLKINNVPFPDMLGESYDSDNVAAALDMAIQELNDCDYIVIACQTLHLFLKEEHSGKVVSLVALVKSQLNRSKSCVVLASRTSTHHKLHDKLLGIKCDYMDADVSQRYIDQILAGNKIDSEEIKRLISSDAQCLLGCTEYSVAFKDDDCFIDPIKLAALWVVNNFKRSTKSESKHDIQPIVSKL